MQISISFDLRNYFSNQTKRKNWVYNYLSDFSLQLIDAAKLWESFLCIITTSFRTYLEFLCVLFSNLIALK